jgi:hypothetical protein
LDKDSNETFYRKMDWLFHEIDIDSNKSLSEGEYKNFVKDMLSQVRWKGFIVEQKDVAFMTKEFLKDHSYSAVQK